MTALVIVSFPSWPITGYSDLCRVFAIRFRVGNYKSTTISRLENLKVSSDLAILRDRRMTDEWKRGKEVVSESLELAKNGKAAEAFLLVDTALNEAIRENRNKWASALCAHGEIIALAERDCRRQIRYKEQSLKYSDDYAFAAYNLALLLLADGQDTRAKHYASEAYKLAAKRPTQSQRDLIAAIVSQWPNFVSSEPEV